MLIVLDTTETFSDLRMEGANYSFLRSFVLKHPAKLIVPQIVVEETVNHFRESLLAHLGNAKRAISSLGKLAPEAISSVAVEVDVESEVQKYQHHLLEQLRLFLADQPPYETVAVATLVERALDRRKPFDAKGKSGFRDAVLWETILQVAQAKAQEIVLVTRNKKDFGEHGGLHHDLSTDLATRGLSQVKVSVCEGLGRFVDEHVKPSLDKLDEIRQQIEGGQFKHFDPQQFFTEWRSEIQSRVDTEVRTFYFDLVTSDCVTGFRDPELSELSDEPDLIEVNDVWALEEGQIAVDLTYSVDGCISCEQDRGNPWEEPFFEPFEGGASFSLFVTVILDRGSGDLVEWQLDDMKIELNSSDWPFPEYD